MVKCLRKQWPDITPKTAEIFVLLFSLRPFSPDFCVHISFFPKRIILIFVLLELTIRQQGKQHPWHARGLFI